MAFLQKASARILVTEVQGSNLVRSSVGLGGGRCVLGFFQGMIAGDFSPVVSYLELQPLKNSKMLGTIAIEPLSVKS